MGAEEDFSFEISSAQQTCMIFVCLLGFFVGFDTMLNISSYPYGPFP